MKRESIIIRKLQDMCIAMAAIPETLAGTLYHADLLCIEMSFIYAVGICAWKMFTLNELQWSATGFFSLWAVWNFVLFCVLRCPDVYIITIKNISVLLALLVGPLQMSVVHWLLPFYAPTEVISYIYMIPVGALQICLYVYFAKSSYFYGWSIDRSDIILGFIRWGLFVGVSILFSRIVISSVAAAVIFAIFLAIMGNCVPKLFYRIGVTEITLNLWMSIIICSAGYGIFILLCPWITLKSIWGYVWYIIALMCVLEFRNMRRID